MQNDHNNADTQTDLKKWTQPELVCLSENIVEAQGGPISFGESTIPSLGSLS